jgi:lipoprotein-releasing system permease protein
MLKRMEESRGKENEEAILPEEFQVRGIFDVGHYEYNANVIITSLSDAQELYQVEDSVHGLFVMLNDALQVDRTRSELRHLLGPEYEITTWTEENSQFLDALAVEKNMMFYLLFFIMIVAAFGIMNSLITFVVQKTREIGVLKALGATRGQVIWIFLSQSLVVGVIGVLLGLGLGMLALEYRNEFLRFMRSATGMELFPSSIYIFTELPALIVPGDIMTICGSALLICLLAGLIPAWTAGRLKPVEALRHE